MTKNAKATKEVAESKKVRSKGIRQSSKQEARDTQLEQSLKDWDTAIQSIKQKSFKDLNSAARAVAERVVSRFGLDSAAAERAIEFVETTLVTDPMAVDYLKKSLNITG